MTLHSAKGLEYPVVFIAGLEEGIFPLGSALEEKHGIEEERRLLYVGMTRARKKLYLCHAASRYRFGQLSYMVRSRFLDEIDPTLVQQEVPSSVPAPFVTAPRTMHAHSRGSRKTPRHTPAGPSPFPAYEDESQENTQPRVGMKVFHESFGRGRIVALEGSGEKSRAIVDFDGAGKKHLLLKYAQLRIEPV